MSEEEEDSELETVGLFTLYTAEEKKDGIYVKMELAGKPVGMQLDTGASVSRSTGKVWNSSLSGQQLSVSYHTQGNRFLC